MIRTIVAGLILFTVMVVSHEFGHFIAAKLTGIAVMRFSVGLGPKLWGFRFHGTEYVLSLVPLGGYVKMKGMEPGEVAGEPDEFFSKSVLVRTFVVLSGPLLNLIFAFLIYFFAVLSFGVDVTPGTSIESVQDAFPAVQEQIVKGDRITKINDTPVKNWYDIAIILEGKPDSAHYVIARDDSLFSLSVAYGTEGAFPFNPMIEPIIGIIEKGSPAHKAGLERGDRIIMVGDRKIYSFEDMREIVQRNPEKELQFIWERDGERMEGIATPNKRKIQEDGEEKEVGMLGVVAETEKLRFGLYGALKEGLYRTGESIKLIVSVIVMLFRREISPKTLGGPIAIFQLAGESARWGFEFYLGFMALLSINLFILNLIPFPPLDGGHILIFAIEKITRRRPTQRQYALIQQIGFGILLIAIAFIFYNDIMRIKNR